MWKIYKLGHTDILQTNIVMVYWKHFSEWVSNIFLQISWTFAFVHIHLCFKIIRICYIKCQCTVLFSDGAIRLLSSPMCAYLCLCWSTTWPIHHKNNVDAISLKGQLHLFYTWPCYDMMFIIVRQIFKFSMCKCSLSSKIIFKCVVSSLQQALSVD